MAHAETPGGVVEPPYGLVAEFEAVGPLLRAARRAREDGYREMDAYTPFPVEELSSALGFRRTRLPMAVLIAGLCGAAAGFLLQYWASVVNYPLNVGGRPLYSWPAFIPVIFECSILAAALTAVIGMLGRNGLPRPHHPLFEVPAFLHASQDRFFLCIEARDRRFDPAATRRFLESLEPRAIHEVPA